MTTPLCQEKQIKTLQKGVQTSSIVSELLSWPRNLIYLCATNDTANNVNKFVRQKKPGMLSNQNLTAGDIVDLHNRTIALVGDGGLSKDCQWINPGELAYVEWASQPEIHEVSLKGRNNKISIKTAKARIKRENGTSDILFLPDYLFAEKPEISSDQMIALKILAREDAAKQLAEKRRELDSLGERIHSKNALPTDEDKMRYEKEKQNYKLELDILTTQSSYFNVAKLRFGYAITVHRAQTYAPFSNVILNCSPYTEFENTETDKYFRWLYTATTCTTENLFLLNYPRKSIFHKTNWNFDFCKISPVVFKHKIYYHQYEDFSYISEEFKCVFENSPKELKSLFIYLNEKLKCSEFYVAEVFHYNYKERYTLKSKETSISIDFNYNRHYDFFIGKMSMLSGRAFEPDEIKNLLKSKLAFKDNNVKLAIDIFEDFICSTEWEVVFCDEKNYKAFVIIEKNDESINLELNIPSESSISKKGVFSSIKIVQASSQEILENFKKDFLDE